MRSATRIGNEKADVERASETQATLEQRLNDLNAQIEQEIAALQGAFDPAGVEIVSSSVRPRKSDITVGTLALLWQPWKTGADGMLEPAFG